MQLILFLSVFLVCASWAQAQQHHRTIKTIAEYYIKYQIEEAKNAALRNEIKALKEDLQMCELIRYEKEDVLISVNRELMECQMHLDESYWTEKENEIVECKSNLEECDNKLSDLEDEFMTYKDLVIAEKQMSPEQVEELYRILMDGWPPVDHYV